ncbi:MAG: hypothetical protein WDM77_10675 [Steroidobacteraceae bacterium]
MLGIVDDPADPVDWMPNIYANYDYVDANLTRGERGYAQFVVAVDKPGDSTSICRQIDASYANSEDANLLCAAADGCSKYGRLGHQHATNERGHRTAGLFMIVSCVPTVWRSPYVNACPSSLS